MTEAQKEIARQCEDTHYPDGGVPYSDWVKVFINPNEERLP